MEARKMETITRPNIEIPLQENEGLQVEDISLRAEEVISAQREQLKALEDRAPLFLP